MRAIANSTLNRSNLPRNQSFKDIGSERSVLKSRNTPDPVHMNFRCSNAALTLSLTSFPAPHNFGRARDTAPGNLVKAVVRQQTVQSSLTGPLLSKLPYGMQIYNPVERGSAPPLCLWSQLGSLAYCADADIEYLRVGYGCRIDRRAALGTERLGALGAAFGSLYINLRLSGT
jgi:hypothetical protein